MKLDREISAIDNPRLTTLKVGARERRVDARRVGNFPAKVPTCEEADTEEAKAAGVLRDHALFRWSSLIIGVEGKPGHGTVGKKIAMGIDDRVIATVNHWKFEGDGF